MKQTVLVTGSAGRLGRAVVAALHPAHSVVGFDLRPTPGIPDSQSVVGSLTDAAALSNAFDLAFPLTPNPSPPAGEGSNRCVIHLAATPDDSPTSPELATNFEPELLPNNLLGGYRVLEAARRAGVKRVVLASTGQVIDGHLESGNIPVTVTAPYRPRFLYACTKVFLEMAGRVYAEKFGLEVLAVRLGWCPRDAGQVAEITADPEAQDVFLSPGDAGRFFRAAVEVAKLPPWAVLYATSKPVRHLLYDLEPAEKLLGWKPTEQWPTGAEANGAT